MSSTKKIVINRLYRSEKDQVLGGVSGGLGEHFDIDPILIRLVFILLTVFGGSGIIVYLILWVIIPSERSVKKESKEQMQENVDDIKVKAEEIVKDIGQIDLEKISTNNRAKQWLGVGVIIVGLALLFDNLGWFNFFTLWPLILIILGVGILFKRV